MIAKYSGTILKCPAESSSTAGHLVQQWSMWRKCPAEKRFAGHQVPKCPAWIQNVQQSTEYSMQQWAIKIRTGLYFYYWRKNKPKDQVNAALLHTPKPEDKLDIPLAFYVGRHSKAASSLLPMI